MCEEEQTLPETRPGPAPTRKSGPNSEERALYRALKPALQASMDRWQLPQSMLHLRGAKSFASVLVGSILLCRLYAGKRPGLEIQGTDAALVPAGLLEAAGPADGRPGAARGPADAQDLRLLPFVQRMFGRRPLRKPQRRPGGGLWVQARAYRRQMLLRPGPQRVS